MTSASLNLALLKPVILQILRGAGFHGANPAAVDVLTEIAAKYLSLLASRTLARAHENHGDDQPDITDVRMAMTDCGLLVPSSTATEETWQEILRPSFDNLPESSGLKGVQSSIRDQEDTKDVQEFTTWFQGHLNQEIGRITGLSNDISSDGRILSNPDGYLTALKRKHSKSGEESKFQGTVLGIHSDFRLTKIEGGPATMQDWLISQNV